MSSNIKHTALGSIVFQQSFVLMVLAALILAAPMNLSVLGQITQENSTRKVRVKPNELSQKIGTAVNWQDDFESAIARSDETGKPIFWYVPTLSGTFMDRKPEINRYMLAGPFSWPDIINVINEHYIAVRTPPSTEQQKKFELQPFKFIEPGFLILESPNKEKEKVVAKVDRMTTLHPDWVLQLLTRSLLQPIQPATKPKALETAWSHFKTSKNAETIKALASFDSSNATQSDICESELLLGMATFRMGKHELANKVWANVSTAHPNEPLAWKAAAESQGIGPFVRGFETHSQLPEKSMLAGIESLGSCAPPSTFSEKEIWNRSVDFILGMQNDFGGFTDSDYDFGGTDSLPNVHVAVTSLAAMSLLKASQRENMPNVTKQKCLAAVKQAIAFVSNNKNVNKVDRDEILWAYAYRLRLVNSCLNLPDGELDVERKLLVKTQADAIAALQDVQSRGGGWYHEYNNPFVTATALLALYEAKQLGGSVDDEKVTKGLGSLKSDRFANGAFPYSSRRRPGQTAEGSDRDVEASAGRMPLCELGLYRWGGSDDESLKSAVERSLALQENLDVALKYDDHTSRLAYGGFFFWYDMRARSEAISMVKDAAKQVEFKSQQKALILALPEIDGCFVDSHELGRVYGTAMALLSLANCD